MLGWALAQTVLKGFRSFHGGEVNQWPYWNRPFSPDPAGLLFNADGRPQTHTPFGKIAWASFQFLSVTTWVRRFSLEMKARKLRCFTGEVSDKAQNGQTCTGLPSKQAMGHVFVLNSQSSLLDSSVLGCLTAMAP